jgi:glyoxylase-like metal-dependent hydrolase (beta-lactamase superfamily II)
VVLASDASHFWENLETGRPFPFIYDLRATREGFRRLTELAGGDNGRVIPGHDSLVLRRFPAVAGHEGRLARLD